MQKFKVLIEDYLLGYECRYNLKEIAYTGLQEGLESPSLVILAGLEKDESPSVVDYYLQQTLTELNIQIPDPKIHALKYIISLVNDICIGHAEVLEGTGKIIHVLQSGNFYDQIKRTVNATRFENIYGLYWACDELANATERWEWGRTNEKIMEDLKSEMVHEYKIWRTKINEHQINLFATVHL